MKTIQLQGIGNRPAKAAKELRIGDIIVWNFGYVSTVCGIRPTKTGKMIDFDLQSGQDGVIRSRRLGAERLVGVEC